MHPFASIIFGTSREISSLAFWHFSRDYQDCADWIWFYESPQKERKIFVLWIYLTLLSLMKIIVNTWCTSYTDEAVKNKNKTVFFCLLPVTYKIQSKCFKEHIRRLWMCLVQSKRTGINMPYIIWMPIYHGLLDIYSMRIWMLQWLYF